MVYSDSVTSQGIVQEVDFLVNTDSNTYGINDKTRNINRWMEKCVTDILQADGRWQWDDANFLTLPRAKTDLSTQQQYSFDSSWLVVQRVDIKDQSGNWIKLTPIDEKDIEVAYDGFLTTPGTPQFYDVQGDNIILFPIPNYEQDDGMEVSFQRKPSYFAVTDTTKEPGFASQFHRILSLGAAYDYAMSNGAPQAETLRQEIIELRNELKTFYASRNKTESLRIKPRATANPQYL